MAKISRKLLLQQLGVLFVLIVVEVEILHTSHVEQPWVSVGGGVIGVTIGVFFARLRGQI
jgi:pyruvate/2-oxoglutarate dehydrogenase complex dihydrolipoamide dehydrogenase (E3) component